MDAYKFTSLGPPSILQGCITFTTSLRRDYQSAEDLVDDLILRAVEINGRQWCVVGLKKHGTTGAYYAGAAIELLVEYMH